MMSHSNSSQSPQKVNLVRPGKTYLHSVGVMTLDTYKRKEL